MTITFFSVSLYESLPINPGWVSRPISYKTKLFPRYVFSDFIKYVVKVDFFNNYLSNFFIQIDVVHDCLEVSKSKRSQVYKPISQCRNTITVQF